MGDNDVHGHGDDDRSAGDGTEHVTVPGGDPARVENADRQAGEREHGSSWLAKIIGIAVVAFWLVMMGTLVRRYLPGGAGVSGAPPLDTATLADAWRNTEEWMDLRWNGIPVGVMRTTALRLPTESSTEAPSAATSKPGKSLATESNSEAESTPTPESTPAPDNTEPASRFQIAVLISLGFGPFQARVSTSALLNDRLILDQFTVLLDLGAPGSPGHSRLRIDGLARYRILLVRIQRGKALQFRTVRLAHPVSLAEGLTPLYSRSDIKVGDTYTLPVFDPLWNMKGGTMTVHVADKETIHVDNKDVHTLRIETTMGNVKTSTWVDDTGKVWRRTVPPLEMDAIGRAAALKGHPWMAQLPPVPDLTLQEMQGEDRGEPLGTNGLLGLLRGAIGSSGSEQPAPRGKNP